MFFSSSGHFASYTLPRPQQQSGTFNAIFVYACPERSRRDGDGKRVKSTINGVTTYFVGAHYEVTGSTVTKYYYAGAQRIAMRSNGTLYYLLGDHLGSTSLTTNASGQIVSELRYKAWGEIRFSSGTTPTRYQYTGQYSYVEDFGLHFYNARWYDSALGRFAQADTIVPPGVQGLDRYAYVSNNPIKLIDPSGHKCVGESEECLNNAGRPINGAGGLSPWTPGREFGLDFRGDWQKDDMQAFADAVSREAIRLYNAYCPRGHHFEGECEFGSPEELYLATHGKTVLTFSNSSKDFYCQRNANAGQAGVTCYANSRGEIDLDLAAHEMGHVFNALIANNGQTTPYTDLSNERDANDAFPGIDIDIAPGYLNNSGSNGEDFANMYSMWVLNVWPDTPGGEERRRFMNNYIYIWIVRQLR